MREMFTKFTGLTKLTGQNIISSITYLIYLSSSLFKYILGPYCIEILIIVATKQRKVGFHPQ